MTARLVALPVVFFCLSSGLPLLRTPLLAQNAQKHSCVVIYDVATGRTTQSDETLCSTRLSPASTFKIPHALVALETGVVTPTTVEKWDGRRHQAQPLWDKDHTVLSSMRPSVLWFFQRIAPRIGAPRMREWLRRFDYGNADTSGPITDYWINGRLRVSPVEQVRFLRRFYDGSLPVAPSHMASVRDALWQQPATMQNARGIHRLEGNWRDGIRLNAKTGAATTGSESVSWLVGRLTVDDKHHVFASAVWTTSGRVDGLDATRLAVRTWIERGLLR